MANEGGRGEEGRVSSKRWFCAGGVQTPPSQSPHGSCSQLEAAGKKKLLADWVKLLGLFKPLLALVYVAKPGKKGPVYVGVMSVCGTQYSMQSP